MSKFKDNFSSESFYPDSNFYAENEKDLAENPVSEDQISNTSKGTQISKDQISNVGEVFEWPNSYWFIAERTNGRLAMIGFMAVIINYTLFGWIAYPFL